MEQYIPKSVVLAEIERLRGLLPDANDCDYLQLEFARGQQDAFTDFEEFIRTLEVKEVDLDEEIDKWICDAAITHEDCSITDVKSTAKHFFELGLKAKEGKK